MSHDDLRKLSQGPGSERIHLRHAQAEENVRKCRQVDHKVDGACPNSGESVHPSVVTERKTNRQVMLHLKTSLHIYIERRSRMADLDIPCLLRHLTTTESVRCTRIEVLLTCGLACRNKRKTAVMSGGLTWRPNALALMAHRRLIAPSCVGGIGCHGQLGFWPLPKSVRCQTTGMHPRQEETLDTVGNGSQSVSEEVAKTLVASKR